MMEWISSSPAQTQAWGQRLGTCLRPGDVLALQGELGTGKTTLVQGIARGLGIAAQVTSPTFALVSEYETPDGNLMRHLDCYRLPEGQACVQTLHLGWQDWLQMADDILIVEWGGRIVPLLPQTHLEVRLTTSAPASERRRVSLQAHGNPEPDWWRATLRHLAAV